MDRTAMAVTAGDTIKVFRFRLEARILTMGWCWFGLDPDDAAVFRH